jgi:hypothetical protein
MIGGVIITGTEPKRVIFRAVGNSMKINGTPVAGRLPNPTLALHASDGSRLAFNDDWGQAPEPERTEIQTSGLQPEDPQEPAILRTLMPGAYTTIVRGVADSTGIALVEVYELTPRGTSQLANLSTRAIADTKDNLMIGGALVGTGPVEVVVRALGPSLRVEGVPIADRLADPTLQVVNAQGTVIAENDDWQSDPVQKQKIQDAGLAPEHPAEAAIRLMLPAGGTTFLLRGRDNTTGVGLFEIYEVPPAPPSTGSEKDLLLLLRD